MECCKGNKEHSDNQDQKNKSYDCKGCAEHCVLGTVNPLLSFCVLKLGIDGVNLKPFFNLVIKKINSATGTCGLDICKFKFSSAFRANCHKDFLHFSNHFSV